MSGALDLRKKLPLINTVVAVLGFMIVIVQLNIALNQISHTQRTMRAQHLTAMHARAFDSSETRELMHKIDVGKLRFAELMKQPDELQNLARFLSILELLGQLEALGMLEINDIDKIFGYYIQRTYRNDQVQEYIAFLERTNRLGFPEFERLATAFNSENP